MRPLISYALICLFTAGTSCSDPTPSTSSPQATAPAMPASAAVVADIAPRVPIEGLSALGNPNAIVTLVSFIDYECPFSARANETFSAMRASYGDQLRIVFANRPLPMHAHARDAALAALAADAQGRFAEMHARLIQTATLDDASLVAAATAVGLDVPRWEAARRGAEMHDALARSEALAQELAVTGTPTSFVDGRRIEGAQPAATFTSVVDGDVIKATALLQTGVPRSALYARLVKDAPTPPADVEAPCNAADDGAGKAREEIVTVHTENAPVRGAADATVSVVVFTDFECPFCQRLDRRLRDLQVLYPDKVKVVYKARPLPMHSNARLAARAGVAAQAQGKFWPLQDAMFENQTSLDRASLERYAAAAGLNMDRFRADVDDPKSNAAVSVDAREAEALGVTGTPTLFVNGRRLVGARPMTELVGAVERAIAEKR